MKFDVVSFGSAVKDVFVGTELAERGKFIAYPSGSKILIKDLRFDIGGGGTNTSVDFSRLGFRTGFIGKIGVDYSGQEILEMLKKERIKFLGRREKEGLTGFSVILDSKEKNRTVLTYKSINDCISLKDVKKFKTRWLYCSSMLGQSLETQIAIVKKMKSMGTKIAYNPSSYLTSKKSLILPILKCTDILILNKEEAAMLTSKKDLLLGLYEITRGIVVITDKDKKIKAYDGKKKYYLMPNKIKARERTGAGDAFASGFVAGRMVSMDVEESLKLGLKESESVIRYFGAKNNLLQFNLKKI